MTRVRFNRRAAFFGALTAFFGSEAYVLAFAKICDSHFNPSFMIGWLFVSNFFMWIWLLPLALICAVIWGLLVVNDAAKTYRVLLWILIGVPILIFAIAFILTPYGSSGSCVI